MDKEAFIENIARVCHEANRTFCQTIGDNSQLSWDESPDWQKDSARNGVLLHINNPQATPQQSHENWLREKQIGGWVWGPVKNPELKQHPCMKPYDELPWEQRVKDYIFRGIVRAMLDCPMEVEKEE